MFGSFLRLFGERVAHKALHNQVREGSKWDIRLGFALLRDRRVPMSKKLLALGLGGGIVALLEALELPVEAILGVLVPILGLPLDAVVDGVEAIIGPFALAALLLPSLAPPSLVAQIRAERAGLSANIPLEGPLVV